MATRPRRVRNLNLPEVEDVEPAEDEHDNSAENENNENLQCPPDIDGLLARMPRYHPRSPIKIIWPNGEVRQVLGDFTISNLLELEGGKVIVGTDENGVPNERSASILGQHLGQIAEKPSLAPLHIQRWDNALFKTHKEQIIKDVEEKFDFPRSTRQLSRDWILRTVNNRWRAYKSKLKKQYFNPEDRSLDEIIKGKPPTVNEHQWRALVGFWCQESHKKLCATNSRSAKEQKNTHTTGRKSHARLKKEMEDKKKRKVHRLELWEVAHKKKNGRYTTDKVETLVDASFEELQKRKENNNGDLSAQDFNEVFNEIVAKELKARGYYGDKYWSQMRVSQGVTFVTPTEEEIRYQEKVNAMENKMHHMTGLMKHWLAFMSKKFPEEDFINEMEGALEDDEDGLMETKCDTEKSPEHSSGNDNSPLIDAQQAPVQINNGATEDHTSLSNEQRIAMEGHADKGDAGTNLRSDTIQTNMRSRRVKAPSLNRSESCEMEVYLISLRNKGRVAAKGTLKTTDSKRVIGGSMLGTEFVGVYVDGIENKGDEELPRPLYSICTLIDAVGFIIPWPKSHVKKVMSSNHT